MQRHTITTLLLNQFGIRSIFIIVKKAKKHMPDADLVECTCLE